MRRSKQAVSPAVCREILSTERRGVLSVIGDEGYPYGVPLDFYYEAAEDTLYFHCAKAGHKLDAMRRNDRVCFTTWNTGYQTPGDWAWHVTSVIVQGRAELIQNSDVTREKLWRLALKYYPTEDEARKEMNQALSRVQLVALHIEHMTGKLVHEK